MEVGIDEAGRGPVLGPMVLAGLKIAKGEEKLLESLGVTDSKVLGNSKAGKVRREELAEILARDFDHRIIELGPATVDRYVMGDSSEQIPPKSLNQLELKAAREIIADLKPERVLLDGKNLFGPLERENLAPYCQAHNKADLDFMSVAGASILAKVRRDQALEELLEPYMGEYGPVSGGGYPNGQTLKFVLWHWREKGGLPPFYRKSYRWKALELALE